MLKRILLFFIVLFLSLFFVRTPLYSQELSPEPTSMLDISNLDFDQAFKVFIDSIDEYDEAHNEYILRRSQYWKFRSLISTQDAFDATLNMLEKRDNVVISYLDVLKVRLSDGIGIPDENKNQLYTRIEDEKYWFANHRDNLSTSGSLDDLVSDSNLAKVRFNRIGPLAYEVMSVLSQGKITKFSERLDELFSETKDILESIRNDEREEYTFSSSRFQTFDRWIFEAEGKIARSKEKQSEASSLIEKYVQIKGTPESKYNNILSKLGESRLHMKGAISFIKEIIRQVKIAE